MRINFSILMTALLLSCGNSKSIDTTQLESFSSVTNAGVSKVDKTGSLIRKTTAESSKDSISYASRSYSVSMYSSYSALEYIAAKPLGYQGSVKFKGEIRGQEIVLEALEP